MAELWWWKSGVKRLKADGLLVFVCSPFAGDMGLNAKLAEEYSRFVYECGGVPVTPHLLFPRFLDEHNPDERRAGLEMGKRLLAHCDQLWAFGDVVSSGMKEEIHRAGELGIPVTHIRPGVEFLASALEKLNGQKATIIMPRGNGRTAAREALYEMMTEAPESEGR